MSYSVVNEELRIQSCSIEDLNPEQFAVSLEDPETITVVYDPIADLVILNRENKDYELYEIAAITFLSVDSHTRYDIARQTNSLMKETNDLLVKIADHREKLQKDEEAKKIRKILGEQPIEIFSDNIDILRAIRRIDDYNNNEGKKNDNNNSNNINNNTNTKDNNNLNTDVHKIFFFVFFNLIK